MEARNIDVALSGNFVGSRPKSPHVVERLNRYLNKVEALVQELGREPSAEEVAKKMKTTEEEVVDLKQIVRTTCSLDSPINDRADTFLRDVIEDPMLPSFAAISAALACFAALSA